MVAGTPRVEDYDVNGDNLPSAGIAETVSMVTWFDRNHVSVSASGHHNV